MKRLALVVVLLYGLLFVALSGPLVYVAFVPDIKLHKMYGILGEWGFWIFLFALMAGQFGLLTPVGASPERPKRRMSVIAPLLATGFFAGALMFGACVSIYEFVFKGKDAIPNFGWLALVAWLLTWVAWTAIFSQIGRSSGAEGMALRQCKALFAGSVLELLVAVPTHVVARMRGYCCAGFLTFAGLVLGLSVMLVSFGPALIPLFAARWRRLRPKAGVPLSDL